MKSLIIIIALFSGAGAFAGDALDSIVKCESVKGGNKKDGPDGNLYTVYVRSETNIRSAKVDVVTQVAATKKAKVGTIVRFPSAASKLVNSWMDLHEEKALFMAINPDGSVVVDPDEKGPVPDGLKVLYVKIKQAELKGPDGKPLPLVYQGKVEAKKEGGMKILDEAVTCKCGQVDKRDALGNPDYSTWKSVACTPNTK